MKNLHLNLLLFALFVLLASGKGEEKNDGEKPPAKKKTIKEIVAASKKYEGLFDIYQDTTTGTLHMLVKPAQLDKEYIHFLHFTDGVLEAGAFRGEFGDTRIFTISRDFNKVVFTLRNTDYYFDPKNALSRSANANINEPVLFVKEIEAKDEDGNIMFEADKLFLTEALTQIKPSQNPDNKDNNKRFQLGKLSEEKSRTLSVKNYPENTDINVKLVFESEYPFVRGSNAVTDARFVGVNLQHTIIRMPENDYKPRFDDPRVGYFTEQVNNMTTAEPANYRDLIHRWNLVKKDKTAALSEPVEPITWWIENTTPKELRGAIRDGVLQWNKAFEEAGFLNAIVVKEQPDNANWDAEDIRYNVLRWTSSPQPPFGGYGPSFVNPRTGQILGADVMLEYVFVTNRLLYEKIFDVAGLELEQDENPAGASGNYCSFGNYLHNNMLFGMVALNSFNVPDADRDEFIKQAIYMLVLHEVGHTLGLNHNMKASNLNSMEQLNDKTRGSTFGLTGSVMDYSNVNIVRDRAKQGLYYDVIPGPYDHWAIQYGYMDADSAALGKLLARSSDKALYFGNDADDMREPGTHIDPRVMIGDMSDDPMAFAEERIKLVQSVYPGLIKKYAADNKSYHALRNAYLILTGQQWNSVRVISRQIGGVYIDRSFAGQPGATTPFTPVDYKTQKHAMELLAKYAFAPDAFDYPAEINNYLQMQHRGFSNYDINEDPQLHDRFLMIQKDVLDELLHPNVLKRMSDTQLYGNSYSLNEMMGDLTNAIFNKDLGEAVNTIRQNLQIEYTVRLTKVIDKTSNYDHLSRAAAYAELQKIKAMMKSATSANAQTKMHRQYVIYLIDQATEIKGN